MSTPPPVVSVVEIESTTLTLDCGDTAYTLDISGEQLEFEVFDDGATTEIEAEQLDMEVQIVWGGYKGSRGEQGIPGETEGATFTATAGESIHGGRVVMQVDGLLYHPDVFDNDDAAAIVGIATTSASVGTVVTVRERGKIVEASWTWLPGLVFCGTDGQLTQTPPVGGWCAQVARVLSATSISVDLESVILRN